MIRTAVLTISDSAHAGEREDLSGPAVEACLDLSLYTISDRRTLPDECEAISAAIIELTANGAALILTTGGTGVAPRDVTPEATRAAIEREIPGLGETMRRKGAERTPRAALSRAVCGLRGQTLIINLPGSPKGAVESLNAIVELIPHIVDLAAGRTSHTEPVQPA